MRPTRALETVPVGVFALVGCGGGGGGGSGGSPGTDANRASISTAGVSLDQPFQPTRNSHTASVGHLHRSIVLTAETSDGNATRVRNVDTIDNSSELQLNLDEGVTNSSTGATDDDSLLNSGTAYVFTRTTGDWNGPQMLKASVMDDEDRFGGVVATDGQTMEVGARFEDGDANALTDSGAVNVFTFSHTTWPESAVLRARGQWSRQRHGIG